MSFLSQVDPNIKALVDGESKRQKEGLELIPSENYVSQAVLEAAGSIFTNKYSEGYPGKRYYGGQEYTDKLETLAIERACELFECNYANVQPLSGAPANIAAYFALCKPGDTILGMDLSHGGHLTHGHPVTHMTKVFNFVRYKMKDADTGEIDYDHLREVALKEKPKLIIAGFSAYSRELNYQKFVDIAKECGALTMADMCHISGLIAGKACKNPLKEGFDIMTTTTHKSLRGPRGAIILSNDTDIAKKIDKSVFPGFQGGPHMAQVAAKAVCFHEALQPSFKDYAQQIIKNAKAMEKVFKDNNIRILCGGTDNHLLLVDVFGSMGVTGKEAQTLLDEVGITLNMNSIADEPRSAFDPSGIRFGTPAITTRGMKEEQCERIAEMMIEVLQNKTAHNHIKQEILALCEEFPIPDTF